MKFTSKGFEIVVRQEHQHHVTSQQDQRHLGRFQHDLCTAALR